MREVLWSDQTVGSSLPQCHLQSQKKIYSSTSMSSALSTRLTRTQKSVKQVPSNLKEKRWQQTRGICIDFERDSEPESISAPAPAKKRKSKQYIEEEELREQEPVRASALRSFLSRRTGSGVSFQRDYTRQGEYYVELRVYSAREAERLGADRWKTALISYKGALYPDSPTWKATTELVKAAKREFQSVQPILYPNQVI
ncbi:hypothetical protein NE865_01143 [Phthorimaea operculella]|nr:hypothetical protein NE865_14996 [Phthorimaea operculella]KAI5646888.1 hypothetical protein NE865_01143 [Phthorimaea operculella]